MKSLLLCCLLGVVAAADLPLGEPVRLEVHADGALLTWQVAVPLGEHRVELPYDLTADLRVSGAAWSVISETVPGAAKPALAALPELVAERNALCAQLAASAGRRAAHEREVARLRVLLAATVARGSLDARSWQASLDAALAERSALDRIDADQSAACAGLLRRGAALAGGSAWLRCAIDAEPLGLAEATRALAGATVPAHARRVLRLSSAAATTVLVTAVLHDVRWSPAAQLLVSGGSARLVRQVRLTKPVVLALAAVPVTVTSQPLVPVLEGPQPRPVQVVGSAVANDARRRVEQTMSTGDWAAGGAASTMAPPATTTAAPQVEIAPPVDARPSPIEAEAGRAVRWELGAITLPVGEVTVVVDRPSVAVAVATDEWAVAPTISPVALRRLGVRLDDQPLLAGPLTLVLDGTVVATQAMTLHPPGAPLTLRAGEDAAIFAEPAVPWIIPAREQSEKRRRDGHTVALRNLGDQPRTVALYQPMPVSLSAELAVQVADATTPGATAVQPGLLRWELTLAPGERREVALGWVLSASGGLKL